MSQHETPGNDNPAKDGGHLLDEADIGSGEKSPGQRETDELIKSIPPLPKDGGRSGQEPPRKP